MYEIYTRRVGGGASVRRDSHATIGTVPHVRIEPGGARLAVVPGERLLDALDEARVGGVAFGCRDASCGSCRVVVSAGTEAVLAPDPAEQATLAALGATPAERLACQLTVRGPAVGEIVLRVVRPSG